MKEGEEAPTATECTAVTKRPWDSSGTVCPSHAAVLSQSVSRQPLTALVEACAPFLARAERIAELNNDLSTFMKPSFPLSSGEHLWFTVATLRISAPHTVPVVIAVF